MYSGVYAALLRVPAGGESWGAFQLTSLLDGVKDLLSLIVDVLTVPVSLPVL